MLTGKKGKNCQFTDKYQYHDQLSNHSFLLYLLSPWWSWEMIILSQFYLIWSTVMTTVASKVFSLDASWEMNTLIQLYSIRSSLMTSCASKKKRNALWTHPIMRDDYFKPIVLNKIVINDVTRFESIPFFYLWHHGYERWLFQVNCI